MAGFGEIRKSCSAWLLRRGAQLRLGIRTTVAGVAAVVVAELAHLPQGYWAVFTAIIVSQSSLGGSLKAASERLAGTLGGALYGAIVFTFLPHEGLAEMAGVAALTLAPLAFLAAVYPRFRIAPLTAIILLIGNAGQQLGPLESAAYRVLEIGLGCLIGLAVAMIVLPARAHRMLAGSVARTLTLLSQLVPALIARLMGEGDGAAITDLNAKIRTALNALDPIAVEAAHERASRLTDDADPEPLARTLRRVRNDLLILGRAATEPLPEAIGAKLGPVLKVASAAIEAAMRGTAGALSERHAPPPLDPLTTALDQFMATLAEVRREGMTRELPDDAVARLFALGFAFDELRENFCDLHARVTEFARAEKG